MPEFRSERLSSVRHTHISYHILKKNAIGLTIGCVLVNLASSIGPIDAVFGGLATLACGLVVGFSRHLAISLILSIAINSFTVGAELYFILKEPFWVNFGFVAVGEFLSMVFGYFLFRVLGKQKFFLQTIHSESTPISFALYRKSLYSFANLISSSFIDVLGSFLINCKIIRLQKYINIFNNIR